MFKVGQRISAKDSLVPSTEGQLFPISFGKIQNANTNRLIIYSKCYFFLQLPTNIFVKFHVYYIFFLLEKFFFLVINCVMDCFSSFLFSGAIKRSQIIIWRIRWGKGKEEMSQKNNSVKGIRYDRTKT